MKDAKDFVIQSTEQVIVHSGYVVCQCGNVIYFRDKAEGELDTIWCDECEEVIEI
ncbi:MAG: hypothetical protein V5A51_11390 [Bacteroidales bacterium]